MRIGFFSPYLPVLGGGEQYILRMASILSNSHRVDIFGEKKLQKKAEDFLGINLKRVNFLPWIASKSERIIKTSAYDRFFYVTDGSLFISLARKNYLIVQVPQKSMYQWNLAAQIRLLSWPNVLVYSNYVKKYIDIWWHTKAIVLPPAIAIKDYKIHKKVNVILSVGRFFPLPHSKKQEVLIEVFRKLSQQGVKGWKLILAGGVDEKGKRYFESVKKKARGLIIDFFPNASRAKLLNLYAKAKIYWHATGFGEDLSIYPERAEHFGITTIEAMASGCVPLVFPAGGQNEIVKNGINGLYWQTQEELAQKTMALICDENLRQKIARKATQSSTKFDFEVFKNKLLTLIQ